MAIAPVIKTQEPREDAISDPVGGAFRVLRADDRWVFVVAGICLAGAAYPVLIVALFASIGVVATAFQAMGDPSISLFNQLSTLFYGAVMFLAFAAVAAIIGTLWTMFLSVIVVPIFALFVRSLQLRTSIVWLGAVCGGMMGLLAVFPIWLSRPYGSGADIIAVFLGPCLTTLLGQIGGAWGGRQAERQRPKQIAAAATIDGAPEPFLRFRIRHLLWITVWLALLLTAIRLAGVPFELVIPVLLAWLVYQSATLYCGWHIARRFLSARRPSRST